MTAPAAKPAPAPAEPATSPDDPAYRHPSALPPSAEDVAVFAGPLGFAAVRKPTSPTAPKRIGDGQGKTFGFYRVVLILKGRTPDVWQVLDAEEGRVVARAMVESGRLPEGLKPNGGKPYRV